MLERIADEHRVPCKSTGPSADDERIIPGKWGHLWQDGAALMICFTDDGAKRALTARKKSSAISRLGAALVRITQNAHAEFCGEIRQDYASVEVAIRVLGVRRFKKTKGLPAESIPGAFQRGYKATSGAENASEGLRVMADTCQGRHQRQQ